MNDDQIKEMLRELCKTGGFHTDGNLEPLVKIVNKYLPNKTDHVDVRPLNNQSIFPFLRLDISQCDVIHHGTKKELLGL